MSQSNDDPKVAKNPPEAATLSRSDDWRVLTRNGDGDHRLSLIVKSGSDVRFGPDLPEVASDTVCLVYYNNVLVGWGDDYGTARPHPASQGELEQPIKDRVEALIEAASDLWELLGEEDA